MAHPAYIRWEQRVNITVNSGNALYAHVMVKSRKGQAKEYENNHADSRRGSKER